MEKIEEPAAEVRSILHGNLSAVQKRDGRLKEAIEVEIKGFRAILKPKFRMRVNP